MMVAAALLDMQGSHCQDWANRLEVVALGSADAFVDYHVFPPKKVRVVNTHFVYEKMDPVAHYFSGQDCNPLNWYGTKAQSRIVNYPAEDPTDLLTFGPHKFHPNEDRANTYDWWAYYVGGAILQNPDRGRSIHGERRWLEDNRVGWWGDKATVQSCYWKPKDQLEWVKAGRGYEDNPDVNNYKKFNPREELRQALQRPQGQ